MLLAQHHVLVLAQDGHDVVRVVLGANGEQDAALRQVQQGLLEVDELDSGSRRPELNAVGAHFADDPAPQGAVQVDHDTLSRQALEWLHVAHRIARELSERTVGVSHASHVEELAALSPLVPRPTEHLTQRQQEGVGLRAEVFRQIAVYVLGPPREAIATPVVENTVRTRACERELMHNDQRSRAGVQLPDEPRDRAANLGSALG